MCLVEQEQTKLILTVNCSDIAATRNDRTKTIIVYGIACNLLLLQLRLLKVLKWLLLASFTNSECVRALFAVAPIGRIGNACVSKGNAYSFQIVIIVTTKRRSKYGRVRQIKTPASVRAARLCVPCRPQSKPVSVQGITPWLACDTCLVHVIACCRFSISLGGARGDLNKLTRRR